MTHDIRHMTYDIRHPFIRLSVSPSRLPISPSLALSLISRSLSLSLSVFVCPSSITHPSMHPIHLSTHPSVTNQSTTTPQIATLPEHTIGPSGHRALGPSVLDNIKRIQEARSQKPPSK